MTCYVILGHSIYQENPAGSRASNNRETNTILFKYRTLWKHFNETMLFSNLDFLITVIYLKCYYIIKYIMQIFYNFERCILHYVDIRVILFKNKLSKKKKRKRKKNESVDLISLIVLLKIEEVFNIVIPRLLEQGNRNL